MRAGVPPLRCKINVHVKEMQELHLDSSGIADNTGESA